MGMRFVADNKDQSTDDVGGSYTWPYRLPDRTTGFQSVKRGSTPRRATNEISIRQCRVELLRLPSFPSDWCLRSTPACRSEERGSNPVSISLVDIIS